VGIGTGLPANKLSVEGSADFTQNIAVGRSVVNDAYGLPGTVRSVEIHNSGTATSSQSIQFLTTASLAGGIGGVYFASPSVTAGGGVLSGISSVYETSGNATTPSAGLFFYTKGGAALTTRMVIAGNGNVGIGVAAPAFMLDVGARMRIRSTTGFTAGLWLNNDANNNSNAFIGMRSDTEVGFFGQTGTPSWRFYINTTTGDGWMQGTLQQNSDARLKRNIVPLVNTLAAIQQLNGYTYNWKNNSNPDEQIGLLAQELQKVYPQLVKEHNGTLSVNYSGMVPVLLEAIKEQQRQNEKMQEEINVLKKSVSQLLKN
jgi:Chaperone of endosialidase